MATPALHAFGFVVPGRPPMYSDGFAEVEPGKWSCDVENVEQIRDVVVFLTQPLAVVGVGLSCYISGPPFEKYHFLGSVDNDSPSAVFRVRWPKEEGAPTAARLGLSLEPIEQILVQKANLPGTELVDFGKQVANDLWNYLGSFEVMHQHGNFLLGLFNKWMQRFEDRCKRDPFWWVNRGD